MTSKILQLINLPKVETETKFNQGKFPISSSNLANWIENNSNFKKNNST